MFIICSNLLYFIAYFIIYTDYKMKGFNAFIGTMIFYIILSYLIMPLAFFYIFDKTLMSAGNGFIAGSILSVLLWLSFRSYII